MIPGERLFFISYTSADHSAAEWIGRQLKQMGHVIRIQAKDFVAGGNFVADMDAGLKEADHVILVLSDGYLRSPYCIAEWTAAFARDPDGSRHHIIPVRVRECRPEGLLGPRRYIDIVGLSRTRARQLLRSEINATMSLPPAQTATPSARIANLPPTARTFVGRSEEFARLDVLTQAGRPVVIAGLPGSGKTTLAIEYARRARRPKTWLVNGADPVSASAGLLELAVRFGFDDPDRPGTERLVALREHLNASEDWLLIVDGLDDPSQISQLSIPTARGQVLVTSRSATWPVDVSLLELGALSPDEASDLLANELAEPMSSDVADLAGYLGGIPLLIRLAAGYVRSSSMPVPDLAELLRAQPDAAAMAILNPGRPGGTDVWSMALESVKTESRDAWNVLGLLAFYSASPIPRSVIGSALQIESEADAGEPVWRRLDRAVHELRHRSLVSTDSSGSLVLHPLVQSVTRAALSREEQTQRALLAARLMFEALPAQPDVHDSAIYYLLGPHALSAATRLVELDPNAIDPPFILTRLGAFALAIDAAAWARDLLRQALSAADGASATEMTNRPALFSYLGQAEFRLGNPETAIELSAEALRLLKGTYGEDHVGVGVELSNRAMYEHGRDNLDVARDLMQQAAAFHERLLGRLHPTTAIDLSNLATIEASAGELSRAEDLLREALEIHEGIVGGDSQAVATDLANLAAVLQQAGQRDEAQALLLRAREISVALFGPEHPRSLWLDERLLNLRDSGDG